MAATRPVLVIEDHADTRHMVEEFLTFQGILTIGAENGLQQRLPDGKLAGVPIVVLSALGDCQRHAHTRGAVDVIPKPIDFDRMLAIVRQYYDSSG